MDLCIDGSHIFDDPRRYRRLTEKLIYLPVTRLDITFVVGILSRFIHQPREVHWTASLRILAYVKNSPEKFCYTRNMNMYALLGTQILVMLVTRRIEKLQLHIAPLLKEIL